MFDLIFDLLGWGGRSRTYRYGPKTYDFDHFLDTGRIDQNPPSPDQVSADYFRQNSPSARSGRYSQPYQPDSQPYMQGEEAAAANGMTVVAVLAIVAVVVAFVLYMYNPDIHMLVTRLLARQ
jgi:hypothetical protein